MVTIHEGYPENWFGPNFAQILISKAAQSASLFGLRTMSSNKIVMNRKLMKRRPDAIRRGARSVPYSNWTQVWPMGIILILRPLKLIQDPKSHSKRPPLF